MASSEAAVMNPRRLQYTLSEVISEDRMSAPRWISIWISLTWLGREVDCDIHSHLYRHAILHGRAESPLFERVDGLLVEFPIQRLDNSNDLRNTVFWYDRVKNDAACLPLRVHSQAVAWLEAVHDLGRYDARTETRRHIVCNELVDLRVSQIEFNIDLSGRIDWLSAARRREESPIAHSEQGILVKPVAKPLHHAKLFDDAINADPRFNGHDALNPSGAGSIAVKRRSCVLDHHRPSGCGSIHIPGAWWDGIQRRERDCNKECCRGCEKPRSRRCGPPIRRGVQQ